MEVKLVINFILDINGKEIDSKLSKELNNSFLELFKYDKIINIEILNRKILVEKFDKIFKACNNNYILELSKYNEAARSIGSGNIKNFVVKLDNKNDCAEFVMDLVSHKFLENNSQRLDYFENLIKHL